MGKTPKSKVWLYFDKLDDNFIKCKLCHKDFKHNGNTTNMHQHIKLKHPSAPMTDAALASQSLSEATEQLNDNMMSNNEEVCEYKVMQPQRMSVKRKLDVLSPSMELKAEKAITQIQEAQHMKNFLFSLIPHIQEIAPRHMLQYKKALLDITEEFVNKVDPVPEQPQYTWTVLSSDNNEGHET